MSKRQGPAGAGIVGGLRGLYDLYDFKPENVNLDDVFKTLSQMCRYGGRCNRFFSVAQHSVLVSQIVADMTKTESEWFTRAKTLGGLCHDFTEAYLTDIIRPIKVLIPGIEDLERNIKYVMAKEYELGLLDSLEIKAADNIALFHEANHLGFDTSNWNFIQEVRKSELSMQSALILNAESESTRWEWLLKSEYAKLTKTGEQR